MPEIPNLTLTPEQVYGKGLEPPRGYEFTGRWVDSGLTTSLWMDLSGDLRVNPVNGEGLSLGFSMRLELRKKPTRWGPKESEMFFTVGLPDIDSWGAMYVFRGSYGNADAIPKWKTRKHAEEYRDRKDSLTDELQEKFYGGGQ